MEQSRALPVSVTHLNLITLQYFETLAQDAMQRYNPEEASKKSPHEETIFDRMITNNLRKRDEAAKEGRHIEALSFEDLADESAMILNGGTEPPANQMAYATYYFLKYPEVRQKLLSELDAVETNEHGRMPLQKLENLPYFVSLPDLLLSLTGRKLTSSQTSFVKESLRMATLIPGRLPRTVPKGGLYVPAIKDTIPEGYAVSPSVTASD